MVRIAKAKERTDHSPNTIRKYATEGLRLYKIGKCTYFSASELVEFIRVRGAIQNSGKASQ